MKEEMNNSQATAVGVALRSLERVLMDIESLCDGDTSEPAGILLRRSNSLTISQRTHMAVQIAEARLILSSLARQFDLPVQVEDAARTARGKLVVAWTTLEDIKSRKLKRYGAISPALTESLDPEVDRLIEIVNTMTRLVPVGGARTQG